jgi:hypothetical protein
VRGAGKSVRRGQRVRFARPVQADVVAHDHTCHTSTTA